MAVRGVVFDLGHTLILLDSTWAEVSEHSVSDLAAFVGSRNLGIDGYAFARAWMARRQEEWALAKDTLRQTTATETMRWAFARFGIADPDPAVVRQAIWASFLYEDSRWQAHPGALDVLRQLSARGLCLGLYSNATDDDYIQYLVNRFGFRPLLDPALSSAGTGIRKPDPAAFAPILAAWSLTPQSVVMIGDSLEDDVQGARSAGTRSVWIPSRPDARQEGPKVSLPLSACDFAAERAICDLAELPGCLDGMR